MNLIQSLEELKDVRWYLASPYRKYPAGLEAAYKDVLAVSEWLYKQGVAHYCPIAASHEWARYAKIDPCDNTVWLSINLPWMGACQGILIVTMDGWETSEGIAFERRVFANPKNKKPEKFMAPTMLAMAA